MKIPGRHQNHYVVTVERGEELFSMLKKLLSEERISAAYFSGLGAADELELAYYNIGTRDYERHTIKEEVEILSIQGNVAWKEGEMILHIHGTFGRRDLSTFGGHLFRLQVSGVCEIHLVALSGKMRRKYDEATGLNTLCSVE